MISLEDPLFWIRLLTLLVALATLILLWDPGNGEEAETVCFEVVDRSEDQPDPEPPRNPETEAQSRPWAPTGPGDSLRPNDKP